MTKPFVDDSCHRHVQFSIDLFFIPSKKKSQKHNRSDQTMKQQPQYTFAKMEKKLACNRKGEQDQVQVENESESWFGASVLTLCQK